MYLLGMRIPYSLTLKTLTSCVSLCVNYRLLYIEELRDAFTPGYNESQQESV